MQACNYIIFKLKKKKKKVKQDKDSAKLVCIGIYTLTWLSNFLSVPNIQKQNKE